MKLLDFGPAWWPDDLGQPGTSGDQNDVAYAFFADKYRLAIKRGASVTVYDSDDHQLLASRSSSGGAIPWLL